MDPFMVSYLFSLEPVVFEDLPLGLLPLKVMRGIQAGLQWIIRRWYERGQCTTRKVIMPLPVASLMI